MVFFTSLNQRYDIIICVYWFELFSQVSNVAHGPLVLFSGHASQISRGKPVGQSDFSMDVSKGNSVIQRGVYQFQLSRA